MTATLAPIVTGIDGSPSVPEVVEVAADRAHRELRPLLLVAAVEDARDAGRAHDGPWHRALSRLDTLRQDLLLRLPALPVRTLVRAGAAAQVLREESSRAAVLVIGTGAARGGLGPVARDLLRAAGCPVLLVPRGGDGADVVAGVDGSAGTTAVLAAAAREAGTRGSPLRVLHTWHRRPGASGPDPRWSGAVPSAVAEAERRLAEAHAARVREGWPAVPVTVDVREGDPARALLDLSRDAALLILGSAQAAGGPDLVERVAAGAHCPVLVVPPPSPAPTGTGRRTAVALGR
ncbi:hypothetical protein GCM10027451_19940 [Geodermatophilus aquaeductus]|uniref:Universal stress protein family protein n=1 Tax=Geodermatophilus aquaeductus TaxID=1564161 RepID=A0A521EB81_9ACTN|nr:universal stress protein [Geodermatophilus aquaeductus]SMO81177.1 Universal stress protein family protein [Geodermatophilus aquaeductus]